MNVFLPLHLHKTHANCPADYIRQCYAGHQEWRLSLTNKMLMLKKQTETLRELTVNATTNPDAKRVKNSNTFQDY